MQSSMFTEMWKKKPSLSLRLFIGGTSYSLVETYGVGCIVSHNAQCHSRSTACWTIG